MLKKVMMVAVLTAPPALGETGDVRELIGRYQAEAVFWQQMGMIDAIVAKATLRDPAPLEPWLTHADRHIRWNVAYLFARLGDRRGFDVIVDMLSDDSSQRVLGPGLVVDMGAERTPGKIAAQIKSDRYYAVHLLGELRDRRAVRVLIPLLDDSDINYKVAWALGQIGDNRAIPSLVGALRDKDALVRTIAIGALVKLNAKSALPAIEALEDDEAISNAGNRVTVGETARKAAASLRGR